ncbi:MAG: Brp/Blh family beta-carotene 15,15'-dioxygenase [Flavobacterium sp.]
MGKIRKISILASFFSLWLHTLIPENWELIISFFLIFSFGIIHGANDITILNNSLSNKNKRKPLQILINYVMMVGFGILFFFLTPSLALLLFIFVSSYHFGEQHFNYLKNQESRIFILFSIGYGMTVLSLLFINHVEEVTIIIKSITRLTIQSNLYEYILGGSILLLITSSIFMVKIDVAIRKVFVEEVFNLLILALIFKVSPLLFGFSVYFIFWHSIPSMYDQIKYLYDDTTFKNTLHYLKNGALYWIISLVGIGVLSYYLIDTYLFEALLFSCIAAITFPHVWVMIHLFKAKKRTQ